MIVDDPIVATLEQVAASGTDICAEAYQRFEVRQPQWAALMGHMDGYMLGRMMQDVLTLLMTTPNDIDSGYLNFEVASHRAYGVTPDMFPVLLACVRDALRNELGGAWTAALETAWQERIEGLSAEIESAAAG